MGALLTRFRQQIAHAYQLSLQQMENFIPIPDAITDNRISVSNSSQTSPTGFSHQLTINIKQGTLENQDKRPL